MLLCGYLATFTATEILSGSCYSVMCVIIMKTFSIYLFIYQFKVILSVFGIANHILENVLHHTLVISMVEHMIT